MDPYTIIVPATGEWLNANRRRNMHWTRDRELTGLWRTAAGWAAKAADVPALGPTRVVAQLRVVARRRSRIDPANYAPTAKACVDGLVDAGIWPDDSADWVEGPDMRLGETAAKPADEALVLLLYGRPCCDGAHTRHGHRDLDHRPAGKLQVIANELERENRPTVEELMAERYGLRRRSA